MKYNCHLATAKHGLNLSEMRLSQIRRADIVKLHSNLGRRHPYAANHLLALIRSMFNRAISWDFVEGENPCRGISKFPELARERFVQADEFPRLFFALELEENIKVRDMFYMCLFTGARRGNVMGMRWDQVNFDRCVWQIPRTKNGTPQSVPLTGEAIAILKARHTDQPQASAYVFPADSKTGVLVKPKKVWVRVTTRATIVGLVEKIAEKKRWSDADALSFLRAKLQDYRGAIHGLAAMAAESGIELKPLDMRDLRVHDLRRTMGSWQASTGASLPIIGRSLNHKSPQSTAIYARLMLDPVRHAMEKATAAMVAVARPAAPTR